MVQEGALDAYLRKKGAAIAVEVRMNMCCDAASAIEYLHAIPIMHRDISARNCLCSGKSLKLSDFGLSKKGVRYQMNSSERTPIRWTAPEVFPSGVDTPKADVWAFGILVWEIFCNAQEEPYRGWDGEKVRAEVYNDSLAQSSHRRHYEWDKREDFVTSRLSDVLAASL
ncbi:unnamed protein product [Toxocara canis]|uniref:Protein kinase domain-containing protein n=1 Tax=Toxocara canis TaxID=6265 RepID=A0A183VGL0_TOXCA|nr:unnamed protein product [Toxocara canis]